MTTMTEKDMRRAINRAIAESTVNLSNAFEKILARYSEELDRRSNEIAKCELCGTQTVTEQYLVDKLEQEKLREIITEQSAKIARMEALIAALEQQRSNPVAATKKVTFDPSSLIDAPTPIPLVDLRRATSAREDKP